jgi:phosphatidate cytidylyltransferase
VHIKRWITGLALLPLLILLVVVGGFYFTLLVNIAVLLTLWEYHRIVYFQQPGRIYHPITLLAYIFATGLVWSAFYNRPDWMLAALSANLVLAALISLFGYGSDTAVLGIIRRQLQGLIYIPLLLALLVLVRRGDNGMLWIFFMLSIVFAGDIAALYIGSFWGRRKLAPAISPGKTIEGSLGGLAANLLIGSIFKGLFLESLNWLPALAFMLAAGGAGQIGDLFESELKRTSKLKDSGGILPGHGGILDRIDALLFAAPVTYFFMFFVFS